MSNYARLTFTEIQGKKVTPLYVYAQAVDKICMNDKGDVVVSIHGVRHTLIEPYAVVLAKVQAAEKPGAVVNLEETEPTP